MTFPSLRPLPEERLRAGSIVYPWGNGARAKVLEVSRVPGREGPVRNYRVRFIDDNIATVHWYMQIVIFPKGTIMDLRREQLSDHPIR
jgi:hypothetical protein